MAQRVAEVDVRAVEWHRERNKSFKDGRVTQRAAEVVIRPVEWHGGRHGSLSGRWSDTKGG